MNQPATKIHLTLMVTAAPPGMCETVVHSLCWQFFVLRWGRRPCPWILWRDGGDKKWQKKVQVEEDSEESDSTGKLGTHWVNDDGGFVRIVNHAKCQYCAFDFSGHCEARPPVYSCRFPHRPLWDVNVGWSTMRCRRRLSRWSLVPVPSVVVNTGPVLRRDKGKFKLSY